MTEPPADKFLAARRLLRTFRRLSLMGTALVAVGLFVVVLTDDTGGIAAAVFMIVMGIWCVAVGAILQRRGRRILARHEDGG